MPFWTRNTIRRSMLAGVAATLALGVGASPALADTELGHSGHVGRHKLRDKAAMDGTHSFYVAPGVTCYYDGTTQELAIIGIKAPKVWARDTTSARNSQMVGFQAIVKRLDIKTKTTTTFAKSLIQQTAAYDDAFADFGDTSVETQFLPDSYYLVVIKMFWYRHGSTEGTAKHAVDYYNELIPPGQPEAVSPCPDRYLN